MTDVWWDLDRITILRLCMMEAYLRVPSWMINPDYYREKYPKLRFVFLIYKLWYVKNHPHLKPCSFPCIFLKGLGLPSIASEAWSESSCKPCSANLFARMRVDSSMLSLMYFWNIKYVVETLFCFRYEPWISQFLLK